MSNKQMTAVDFLGHNMAILSFKLESNNITQEEFNIELYNLFQQAKEMENNLYICNKCKSQINEKETMQQVQDSKKSD
jgi:hypothetical protein